MSTLVSTLIRGTDVPPDFEAEESDEEWVLRECKKGDT
jgi:hypothetical protein